MYQRLLVPTDGSQTAASAGEHAIEIAQRFDAELHVLYIIDASYPYAGPGSSWVEWDTIAEHARKEGNKRTLDLVEAAKTAGVEVHRAILEHQGTAEGILTYADEHDIDAIVMGTHGRSGVSRFLLGSVAEKVLRASRVPVLVVPGKGRQDADA